MCFQAYQADKHEFWIDEFSISRTPRVIKQTSPPKLPNNIQGLPISALRKQITNSSVSFVLNMTFTCPTSDDCKAPLQGLDFEIEIFNNNLEESLTQITNNSTDEGLNETSNSTTNNSTDMGLNQTSNGTTNNSMGLSQISNSTGNSTTNNKPLVPATVTLIQNHSEQISGEVIVKFQGQIAKFDAQSSAADVRKKLLGAFTNVPDLKVVRLGAGQLGYGWFVTFTGKPGDLPEMEVDGTLLAGPGVKVTVQTIEDGECF
jgi:hypothetical protein